MKGRRSVEYIQKVGALNNPGTNTNSNVVFEILNFIFLQKESLQL